jgi:K+-transporting ATPase ATPase A chain
MVILFLPGAALVYAAEATAPPAVSSIAAGVIGGPDAASGNMEGKEVCFGLAQSALFAAVSICSPT